MQLSANALTVLKKRYLAPSPTDPNTLETPDQMWDRVAQTMADVDKNYGKDDAFIAASFKAFRKILADLDFLPNSPTLANASARTGQLSACFVLPIEDCLSNAAAMAVPGMGSGIFDTIRAAAIIHQTGGGTGFSFSKLRPKHREGTEVGRVKSTNGGASGPISFMDVYNAATESIKQGGMRRGANMGILRIDHPDIRDFISHKEDLTKLTNFNISVAVTDAFMKAVADKTSYDLIDPSTGAVVDALDANAVFEDIVQRAWSTGEPGIVFIDRMNDYCPVPWLGKYEATNPCFVASTVIKSPEGDITLGDLAARYTEYPVYAFDKAADRTLVKMGRNPRKTGSQVPVMTLTLDNGKSVTATPNHKFWVRKNANDSWERGDWVELQNLKPGMSLTPFCTSVNPKGHERISTGAFHEGAHRLYAEFMLGRALRSDEDVHHKNGNKLDQRWSNLEVLDHAEHSREHKLGDGNPMWSEITPEQLIQLGKDLVEVWGPGFTFREYRDLTQGIRGFGVKKLLSHFGTWDNFKSHVVGNCKVVSVVDAGVEDVYNITVDDVHNYFANGVLVKNCGEQPLLPYESCNLGSINLENFVVEEPDSQTRIDWIRLGQALPVITHMMDNIIDANKYPIPEIEAVSLATRKLGIGVMGFGRMLYKLGVGYGSPESLTIASQIFSFIDYGTKLASVRLATWKGSFPARIGHAAESTKFFDRICNERAAAPHVHPACDYIYLAEEIAQYGIRNSNTTTVAPTGTLSIIADTSGGCEPVFALAFKRWQAETNMVDSDDVFRQWLKRTVHVVNGHLGDLDSILEGVERQHGSLITFLEKEDTDSYRLALLKELKFGAKVFVTAHDISPRDHVNVQAAFQTFNDSAVSKTINFAESATTDDVREAYMYAYEKNCKGITVYRNNSRKFQPLSVSEKPAAVEELAAVVPMAVPEKPKVCPTCGACNPCGDECLCGKPPEPKTLFEVFNGEPPFATMTNIGQAAFEELDCHKPAGG